MMTQTLKCLCHHNLSPNVLQSCGISQKLGALWDIARKRNEFLLFSIVLRILQLLITLESLVWFRWGFHKMYLYKWALQSNRKLKMSHVLLQTDFFRSHHIWWKVFRVETEAESQKIPISQFHVALLTRATGETKLCNACSFLFWIMITMCLCEIESQNVCTSISAH